MEDRKLNERESLELITRMIKETQENVARHAAYPLLIWGYTTVVITIVRSEERRVGKECRL